MKNKTKHRKKKSLVDGLNSRMERTEERISVLKDRTININRTAEQID